MDNWTGEKAEEPVLENLIQDDLAALLSGWGTLRKSHFLQVRRGFTQNRQKPTKGYADILKSCLFIASSLLRPEVCNF